ncbi:MAG: hypothetical protein IKS48_06405 [Eubacterium sp.]|nr:hypothetical protein [Eubacterium sp.]
MPTYESILDSAVTATAARITPGGVIQYKDFFEIFICHSSRSRTAICTD